MKPRDLWDLRDRWEQEPATGGARANGKAAAPGTRYLWMLLVLARVLAVLEICLVELRLPFVNRTAAGPYDGGQAEPSRSKDLPCGVLFMRSRGGS